MELTCSHSQAILCDYFASLMYMYFIKYKNAKKKCIYMSYSPALIYWRAVRVYTFARNDIYIAYGLLPSPPPPHRCSSQSGGLFDPSVRARAPQCVCAHVFNDNSSTFHIYVHIYDTYTYII